jgi:hypothetical protein
LNRKSDLKFAQKLNKKQLKQFCKKKQRKKILFSVAADGPQPVSALCGVYWPPLTLRPGKKNGPRAVVPAPLSALAVGLDPTVERTFWAKQNRPHARSGRNPSSLSVSPPLSSLVAAESAEPGRRAAGPSPSTAAPQGGVAECSPGLPSLSL